jgi:Spy/CpxP family protein refolding chaperone
MAAEKQAYQEIVDALISGEMDREAARAAIEDLRGAGAETRESLKAIFDEKREALEADKTINDALRDTLRALLTAEMVDEAAVQNALDEVIAQLQSHIALDEKYAAMADAVMVP